MDSMNNFGLEDKDDVMGGDDDWVDEEMGNRIETRRDLGIKRRAIRKPSKFVNKRRRKARKIRVVSGDIEMN